MPKWKKVHISDLTYQQIYDASKQFKKHEKTGPPIYRITEYLIDRAWNNQENRIFTLADAVSVLLLVWNQGFYRYGSLNSDKLNEVIENDRITLDKFRGRSILDFTNNDIELVKKLYKKFLGATSIKTSKKQNVRKSPVSVAKALHMMAPNFFPLWDTEIAIGWGCRYDKDNAADKYIDFIKQNKRVIEKYKMYDLTLKMLDECSYAIYTQKWYTP